jgi:methylmalonyl-CoA mutase
MTSHLFSEFGPADKSTWEKQAMKELKDKFSKATTWKIAFGVDGGSYHTSEDLDPRKAAEMQQCQKKVPGWLNMPVIIFSNPTTTNVVCKNALQNGADAIVINLADTPFVKCEFPKLLHGIRLSDTPVFFQTTGDCDGLLSHITKNAGYYLKGGIAQDPIAHQMRSGVPFDPSMASIASVLNRTKNMREFRPLMVETHIFHNNGADPVQELALMLASTVTYLDHLTDAGISPLTAFNRILFSVSVGTQYLTEIAKLRAARYLLNKISRAYSLPDELCIPFIHAKTSSFYNTTTSPHTNIVRTCAEAMSAVLGGCNAITVSAFDQTEEHSGEFASRIARNVSSVLKYESMIGTVADPAAGSYMLENMSLSLAEAAWTKFLDIEEKGGLLSALENGYVHSMLQKAMEAKVGYTENKSVLHGLNPFADAKNQDREVSDRSAQSASKLLHDQTLEAYLQNRSVLS